MRKARTVIMLLERVAARYRRWRVRRRMRRRDHLYVVSGLPRSGTSLMMRILHRGGIPVVTDSERTPDESNPKGYFEHERVKKLAEGDRDWLRQYEGHAVKIVAPLLQFVPSDLYLFVVFMHRDLDEVLASQAKMTRRLGTEDGESTSDEELRALYREHLREVREFLAGRDRTDVCDVDFNRLVASPIEELESIQYLLTPETSVEELASVVDPSLYRSRS